jgi:two-component system sensor histidine kinase/response regulator
VLRGAAQRFARAWRYWLPAALLALLGVVVTQELDLWLLRRVAWLPAEIISGILNAALILIPVALYVMWRRNAIRYRAAYRKLQAAEALREDLANMLVHDLKNPIITAGLALGLLGPEDDGHEITEARRGELIALAADSLRQAERMVGDILQIAQAEAGKIPLEFTRADTAQVVRAAVAGTALWLEEASVKLREEYPSVQACAMMDCQLIQRVVENLLMNAAKYTPGGGNVLVRVERTDSEVCVSDSGPGIPADMRTRIFDRFQQAQAGRQQARHDVGLGLAFARLAVEAHGGSISVQSESGQGTTFTFTLPACDGTEDS